MTDRAELPARLLGADMDHVSPVDTLRLHDENPEAFPLSPEDVEAIIALIDEAAARIEVLEAALRALLACEYESASHGLLDCIDNDGRHYQSAHLAKCIADAESLLQ